jgi:phosphate starvation-inducible PhoH-like protein
MEFDDAELARELFGPGDDHLRMLARESGLELNSHGSELTISGGASEDVDRMANLFIQLYGLLKAGQPVFRRDMRFGWNMLRRDPGAELKSVFQDAVYVASPRKTITPKTLTQKEYVQAIRDNEMVFGIGPAGTGKTYLAVAMAVTSLLNREVKRLVLTRPAVEAGERLGFLPGDLVEKVNPYLRPLYDALHDMLEFRKVSEMLETGVIEVAPLAFMRGRTLNDAFVILDEAQNTTPEQMKMFLTRLGFGSRAVITGDVTQIDLPLNARLAGASRSGLVQAEGVLDGVEGVRFIHFSDEDVIRHQLVARIVQAYERHARSLEEK